MKYIKTGVWILVLSLLYAGGLLVFNGLSAELLYVFSGLYAYKFRDIRSSVAVALVCGILMSGLGGRGFAFSLLSCVYFSAFCLVIPKIKYEYVVIILCVLLGMVIFEGLFYMLFCMDYLPALPALLTIVLPASLYNTVIGICIFGLMKKIYSVKEKFIFIGR